MKKINLFQIFQMVNLLKPVDMMKQQGKINSAVKIQAQLEVRPFEVLVWYDSAVSYSNSRCGHYFCSNLYGRVPRGPSGVKKSDFFLQIKLLSFCTRIAPKRHKLRKIVKIGKKNVKKKLVFLEYFEYSSIWGQY